MTPRYAIYALPGAVAPDPLRPLAEAWLGRATDGSEVTPAEPDGWTRAELDTITVDARRYGFHATLKAPFRLADGLDSAALDDRVAALAHAATPVTLPHVGLYRLDGFYALMAGAPAPALRALADAVVRDLDDLRAPMTDAERDRRRPERLTPRQRELLDAWGYPYVFDELRLHFTLTDRIPERQRTRVTAALIGYLADRLDRDVPIDALCVFDEPEPGAPFRLRSVHALGSREPQVAASPASATHRGGAA
jgi:putative phosphonate metabolism protein